MNLPPFPPASRLLHDFRMLRLSVICFLSILASSPMSEARPPLSATVQERGVMVVDAKIPWISGWSEEGVPINLEELLNQLKAQGSKGVYLSLCASWSVACEESLKLIHNQSGRLKAEDIFVVVVFLEDTKPHRLKPWLDKIGVSYGTHLKVIIDRYHRSAIRLGAYEERSEEKPVKSASKGEGDQERLMIKERVKRLKVPLGVVLSPRGKVLSIVTQEGTDLIDHISRVIRYSGE